jgi:hypothetical protein
VLVRAYLIVTVALIRLRDFWELRSHSLTGGNSVGAW